jgi:hypothetical protein
MSAVATEPPSGYRTSRGLRRALLAGIALIASLVVAQGTVALLDLAARHTTTQVRQFDGVGSLVIDDASDVRLTSAPAGAPLELVTKVTEGLRTPSHDARVTGDGTLHLSSSCGWVFGNSCAVDYEIRVPAGTRVRVDAASGDVHAEQLRSTRPVVLTASSGDVDAIGVTAPALRIRTSSGDIGASRVRAGTVTVGASSGDVRLGLAEAADRLTAVASSGDIHVSVPDARYRVDTEAGSGDVDDRSLRTSPEARRSISATSGSGDIHLEAR